MSILQDNEKCKDELDVMKNKINDNNKNVINNDDKQNKHELEIEKTRILKLNKEIESLTKKNNDYYKMIGGLKENITVEKNKYDLNIKNCDEKNNKNIEKLTKKNELETSRLNDQIHHLSSEITKYIKVINDMENGHRNDLLMANSRHAEELEIKQG